jgi:predicted porin
MRKLTFVCLTSALTLGVGVAEPARAEVTLYGILDTDIGYTTAGGKGTSVAVESGGENASRVGLRGSEDLGGGLRATFTLENGIVTNTGAATDATRAFSRQSWVGLAGQYGEVRVGRQNSALLLMHGKFDAFGGGTFGSFLHNASTFTFRFDNEISYLSPNIHGFTFTGAVSLGGSTSPHDSLNAYEGSIDYARGPLYMGVSHAEQNGVNGDSITKSTIAGASYRFGKFTTYLGYYRGNNLGGNVNTNIRGTYHSVYTVSEAYLATPALKLVAGLGWAQDSSSKNNDAGQASIGAFYSLSKRTTLYTTAARLINRHGATYSLQANGPITANVPTGGSGVTGAQIGMIHLF